MLALVRSAVETSPTDSLWEVTEFGWDGWNQRPGLSPWEVEATFRVGRVVLFGRDELAGLLQNLVSIDESSFDAYVRSTELNGGVHVLRWLARIDAYVRFEFTSRDALLVESVRRAVSAQGVAEVIYYQDSD